MVSRPPLSSGHNATNPDNGSRPLSSSLLVLFGAALVLMGLYFALLRPPLLPEDVRFFGASQAQLDSVAPQLASWLKQVFRVMGGYVAATGVLTITLAATSFRQEQRFAAVGAFIGGLSSIGLMTAINFSIDSDFKWVLLDQNTLTAALIVQFPPF
jgi:RsiW-degrading membrane proteinase PrsW (M82 family)